MQFFLIPLSFLFLFFKHFAHSARCMHTYDLSCACPCDDTKHKTNQVHPKSSCSSAVPFSAGNDVPDVACLNLAGLSAVPSDVPLVVLNAAKYPCQRAAGHGAVREFIEHILLMKGAKFQKENNNC